MFLHSLNQHNYLRTFTHVSADVDWAGNVLMHRSTTGNVVLTAGDHSCGVSITGYSSDV